MREGCRRGKLTSLVALLDQYGETVEADLLRVYGIDLLDLYRGRLSLRRLAVLIDGLPADCRTTRRLANVSTTYDEWSQTDLLLGRLLEVQTESEVLPRADDSSGAPRESVPVVPISEAMGLVTKTPEEFFASANS